MTSLLFIALLAGGPNTESAPLLTLDAAIAKAQRNNLDMQIAKERVERAAILSKKAWSVVLPVISASYSLTRFDREISISMGPGQDVVLQALTQKSAAVNIHWTLLSGRSIPLIQTAEATVDIAQLQFSATEHLLRYAVIMGYYNVLNADKQVAIRERGLDVARAHERLADARLRLGSATRVDVLRSQAEVAAAEQALIQTRNAAIMSRRALVVLLGDEPDTADAPALRLERPTHEKPRPAGDPMQIALEQRLDLKQSHLELEIAKHSKWDTWTRFLPALVGVGAYNWSNAAGFSGDNTNWRLGLALQWEFFSGGFYFWELGERQHDINAATLAVERNKRLIRQEIADAHLEVETAEATYHAAQKRLALAQQSAKLVALQYENGAAVQLDVLDANRNLADAETAAALALLHRDIAHVNLQVMQHAPLRGN